MNQDTIIHLVMSGIAVAWLIVQLYTNGKIQDVKLSISDVKLSIVESCSLIKEHVASDLQKHDAIDNHLAYTDKRVDRLEDRKTS